MCMLYNLDIIHLCVRFWVWFVWIIVENFTFNIKYCNSILYFWISQNYYNNKSRDLIKV